MSEFNKDAPAFTPSAPAAKLNLVTRPTATAAASTQKDQTVDDVTASVAKVKIRHDFEGDRKNYRDTFDHLRSGKTFGDFNIPASCLKSLTLYFRYNEPTQIQAETIPKILDGRNLLAQAQAGSGKSIAFAIGILNQVDTTDNRVQAICIAPTRHLASQLQDDAIAPLAKYMDPPCRIELGVRSEDPSDRGPPKGASCPAHVVVGTAGTIIKWMKDKYINASAVKIFVVDEADEMVKESKGSASTQVLQIKKKLPVSIQTLCFSATYPPAITALANRLVGENAVTIKVKKESDLILDKIFQVKIECRARSKVDILEDVYSYFSIQQSMVFCETKRQCEEVKNKLTSDGFTCSVIYGKSTNADEEFELFRQNKTKVLISTDILSRGIDVPTVAVVINYDAPRVYDELQNRFTDKAHCETYTHRIARCSRMGNPGTAITLIRTPCDRMVVSEIERHFDTALHAWDEDEVEALSQKHAELQSGATLDVVLDEKAAAAGGEEEKEKVVVVGKVENNDWT
jgi:ATP-dependent RNA helicase DDX19/DBP5